MINTDSVLECITRRAVSRPSSVALGSIPKLYDPCRPPKNPVQAWRNPETLIQGEGFDSQLLVIRETWKPQREKFKAPEPVQSIYFKTLAVLYKDLGVSWKASVGTNC